jgi:hypothetical protein
LTNSSNGKNRADSTPPIDNQIETLQSKVEIENNKEEHRLRQLKSQSKYFTERKEATPNLSAGQTATTNMPNAN